MQIIPGIYQIGGSLNGLTYVGQEASYEDCNSYIVKAPEGLILFDCGCGESLDQLLETMRQWDLSIDDVRACLITHSHLDHCGGAHRIKERGIPLYAHLEAARAIEAGDERCCGFLYHKEFIPCTIDHVVRDEQSLSVAGLTIRCLHLPGHTMGCTAYLFDYENRTVVVSGDIIGTLLDGYFGWDGSIDFDKQIYLQSLLRFSRIDTDIMLPGHGMVYHHRPRARVEDALNAALSAWR